jgi:D-ribose pyranase
MGVWHLRERGILNPQIEAAIAALGHTEYLAVGDCGLPMPEGIPVIDLSLVRGIPTFSQVLKALAGELVVESYIYAKEADEANPGVVAEIKELLPGIPSASVPHEEFKAMTKKARAIIRTGEYRAYANIILVGGVNF